MKQRYMVIDVLKCHDCNNCFMACKDEHVGNSWPGYTDEQPRHGHRWMNIERRERGQYSRNDVAYLPMPCQHCEDAPCVAAGGGAVYRREDGVVMIDPVKAKGNQDLLKACPYGAIYWNEELRLPQKCTGCAHLLDEGMVPHCVDVCATGALRYGEETDFGEELDGAVRLTDQAHGGLVYYANMPKLFISGDVWDPAPNEVVSGARVTLSDSSGGVVAEAKTDGFGDFWFRRLDPGDYIVTVEAPGYLPQSREVSLDRSLNVGDFPLEVARP